MMYNHDLTYTYVDPTNGDDDNDGLTPETPKKTLRNWNSIALVHQPIDPLGLYGVVDMSMDVEPCLTWDDIRPPPPFP